MHMHVGRLPNLKKFKAKLKQWAEEVYGVVVLRFSLNTKPRWWGNEPSTVGVDWSSASIRMIIPEVRASIMNR